MTDKSPAGPSPTAGPFEARSHKDSAQVAPPAISAFSNLNRQVASSASAPPACWPASACAGESFRHS